MSFLSDIKTLISSGGVTTTIRIGKMPSSPDNCIALYHSGGYARSLTGTKVEEPTFQVRIRNTSYENAVADCNLIKDALHAHTTSAILMIEQQGDIQDLGPNNAGQSEFTLNFRCYYRR